MEVINEENITQHFSLAEITWKIKNISLAICPLQMSVNSDEFQITGLVDTLWRLSLSISHEQNTVAVYLKMLGPNREFFSPDGRTTGLRVNWKSNFLDSIGEQALTSELVFLFNYRDNIAVETFTLTDVLRSLPHIGPDDLTLKCHILIDHGKIGVIPMTVPGGLVDLSNTLVRLPTEPLFPDITITVGKSTLALHKDMFYNVKAMGTLIEQQNSEKINLLNHDYHSLECLFRYAYSGNLNYVISIPRIRIYEDIERMAIPELQGAYPKEIIPLESNIEAKSYFSSWKIENIELVQDTLDGPEFHEVGMNSIWQIRMHPKGKVNSNSQEKKYVFFEAALLWSNTPDTDVNIEFCSLNAEGEIIYSRREHKRMKVDDKLELPFFLNGGTLMKKCIINNDLLLRVTLWISTGELNVAMGRVIDPVPFELNNTITLNMLSRKMAYVLQNPHNFDMILLSGKFCQRTHKFVLGSRSPFIKARLAANHGAAFTIPNFDKHFIRVFIENLYTGLLSDVELASNCHMFEFGFMFEVNHLISRCRQEITPTSVLEILEYADNNNLVKVRSEAFKLITQVGEAITGHMDWNDFLYRKTNLALDILDYLGLDRVPFE